MEIDFESVSRNGEVCASSGKKQNKIRKKENKVGQLWKFLLRKGRNKNPGIFHDLLETFTRRLLDLDQKPAKVKMFSIILHKCCESDFLQRLTRIGHLSASRWLPDISRIKATLVSHLIDCSAFFLLCCCLQYRHSC